MKLPFSPCLLLGGALFALGLPALTEAAPGAAEILFELAPRAEVGLSEAEAVQRSLGRPSLRDAIEGSIESSRAEVEASRRWTNPTLGFAFEQAKQGGVGGDESIYTLSQNVEPPGRRRARIRSARTRVLEARLRGRALRVDVEARTRTVFAEVLAAQERFEVALDWERRMGKVAELVALRRAAFGPKAPGRPSKYASQRVRREQASISAKLSQAKAERRSLAQRLLGILGEDPDRPLASIRVAGELLPRTDLPPIQEFLARLQDRPDILAEKAALKALEADAQVARAQVSAVTLAAGYKDARDSASGGFQGPVAFASLPLPLLHQQQAPKARAKGQLRAARGRLQMRIQEESGEIKGLFLKTRQLTETAQRFSADTLDQAKVLRTSAEDAYRSGEVGLLSLLDAYRGYTEARFQFLELALSAQQTRIELERRTGGHPTLAPAKSW